MYEEEVYYEEKAGNADDVEAIMKNDILFEGQFFALFKDGSMGFNDGVGYLGTMERNEVEELYKELKNLFEIEEEGGD